MIVQSPILKCLFALSSLSVPILACHHPLKPIEISLGRHQVLPQSLIITFRLKDLWYVCHLVAFQLNIGQKWRDRWQGIIEESSRPWLAPVVFVPKKSGDLRMCIDYRHLNQKTVKDAYPLPLADEVQNQLAGSTIFSILDLRSGYWQIPVHRSDQYKTAFVQDQK